MLRTLALLVLSTLLIGCSVSEDDRDFYYRGWLNPNRTTHTNEPHPVLPSHPVYKTDPLIGN